MELSNNTILITGGTSGFGLEFAKKLVNMGNTVIITGRDIQKLEDTKRQLPEVHTIQSDVSKPEDIKNLYYKVTQTYPGLNILINNAGEMRRLILHEKHNLEDITREIDINLSGPIRMVQQFLPHLKKQPAAAILNVTSGIALMSFPLAPIYSASKAGLRFYTQALRIQLKNTDIKVFELVAPGSNTPLNDKFTATREVNPKMLAAPEKIVDDALKGLQSNRYDIFPGISKLIRIMSRLAPKFTLAQAAKMSERAFLDR